eukprot:CAMPEP_0118917042 /NCGR_PEP_ID=MMETSP1166-20130328/16959_1 /TAXON_ID=1104430 /ORGANISM="Chrysoreinhardia sp, Strain CCMP3193" /LENGTH=703 /DNA_ID=CAMNT_0006857059 /DNA_START=352 /DNA_END=2463 /DNA_ORIENTATION=+
MDSLASFMCHFIQYEPLETVNEFPTVLPSPTQVLAWRVGDSFDLSVLLTSFLLGAGYDAYVVVGSAPSWICFRDESRSPSDRLEGCTHTQVMESATDPEVQSPKLRTPDATSSLSPSLNSLSWQETGLLHSWILVRGLKRDPLDLTFIEPTTGRLFTICNAPYLEIEAIWNNKNYWVNMQEYRAPVQRLDFDLSNTDSWEAILLNASRHGASGTSNMFGEESVAQPCKRAIDIPPSWVLKLELSRDSLQLRFPPDGHRTLFYQQSKLELFAEGVQPQGLASKLITYNDTLRTIAVEIREKFLHRRDKLLGRVRYVAECRVVEEFAPGRAFSLSRLTEVNGYRRTVEFYVSARQDGLVRRDDLIGCKIVEYFRGRADRLTYRAARTRSDPASTSGKPQFTLPNGESTGDLIVQKMTQKFSRPVYRVADRVMAKRCFYVQEGQIRSRYHYQNLHITRPACTHTKEPCDRHSSLSMSMGDSRGRTLHALQTATSRRSASVVVEVQDSPLIPEQTVVQPLLTSERDCLTDIRRSQLEALELLKLRRCEEADVVIEKPRLDPIPVPARGVSLVGLAPMRVADDHTDYLTPFLHAVEGLSAIGYAEAQRTRDQCLMSLKERLIERANIIMLRLSEENSKLAKKQAMFQRNQRENDPSAEEEFERICSEAMFRIHILEQRLASHEECALQKFQELDLKLSADKRLGALKH